MTSPHTLSEQFRLRLGQAEHLPLLALLGIICGLLAGGTIILFRLGIEAIQGEILGNGQEENFEQLSWQIRLLLPIAGGVLIGLIFTWAHFPAVGITHLMERLAYHQARLPLRNALYQWVGVLISLGSGHSVGREGPAVHLGGAGGSLLASMLRLPDNVARNLVACGVAAAIGASFNTPLAGVIFAMEVVLLEYTLTGFAPIILAAVSATALNQWFFGSAPAFAVPPLQLGSLTELPYVLLCGLIFAAFAALFTRSMHNFVRIGARYPFWLRTTIAGLLIGVIAIPYPQIMGIGYDTVNLALSGEIGLWMLIGIGIAKLLATSSGLGLGLPGGLIGPSMFMGATIGAACGIIGHQFFPDFSSSIGFYTLLGMGAVMGAVLQAPLAALIAMLELTGNPNILMPGMLAVISAGIAYRELFHQPPIFISLLKVRGLDYRSDPVTQSLQRLAVTAAMARDFIISPRHLSRQQADQMMQASPTWIVLEETSDSARILLEGIDLGTFLQSQPKIESIDLLEIPASSRTAARMISARATLHDALQKLLQREAKGEKTLIISGRSRKSILGILTRAQIERHYRYPEDTR